MIDWLCLPWQSLQVLQVLLLYQSFTQHLTRWGSDYHVGYDFCDIVFAPIKGKTILVDLQDLDEKELAKCSDKVKERVMGSHEYKAIGSPVVESEKTAAGIGNGGFEPAGPDVGDGSNSPQSGGGFDSDIPFNQVNCKVY